MKNINLRKSMAVTMAAAMVVGMTGCGNSAAESNADANADTTANEAQQPAADDAAAQQDANAADTTTDNAAADTSSSDAAAEEANADLSGTISMAGSTSMEKLANAVAESFMAKYPNVTVTAEFTGSSAGIESLLAGSVDIGNASRALKDSEVEGGAVENTVAIDGIAGVVDKDNAVTELTKDQLTSIYKS